MRLSEYQKKAHATAIYPKIIIIRKDGCKKDISWVYPIISWIGEIGELCNGMKKVIRDDNFEISKEKLEQIKKEVGDCMWYNAEFCTSLKLKMNDVGLENIKKLQSRKKRGKVRGSGDNR